MSEVNKRMITAFYYHSLRRDLSNFSLLKHRHAHGFIVSMHQSGTHWLKYALAIAMARQWDLPPPQYNHANDYIPGPKGEAVYPQMPRIVSSHSIPHALLRSAWFRQLFFMPRFVILVRDMRASLVSNYEKWKDRYAVDFSDYLRGDPGGCRFNSDIWWCLRFYNAWGRIAARFPANHLVVRYEDMLRDPRRHLECVSQFFELDLDGPHLDYAVQASGRERMAGKHDPSRPPGEISTHQRDALSWFSDADQRFFNACCERFLHYRFGYEFQFAGAPSSSW